MKRIGVTGGIGSGKTIVCRIFSTFGIPVYNADQAARRLMNESTDIHRQLQQTFGNEVIGEFNKPDRSKIASIVFGNPEALIKLNNIVHPAVFNDFVAWEQNQNAPYTIREAAILFESGLYKKLDHVIIVDAPEQLRIERVRERDQRDEDGIRKIIRSQWSSEEKIKLAWKTIINDEQQLLIPQVLEIHNLLLND